MPNCHLSRSPLVVGALCLATLVTLCGLPRAAGAKSASDGSVGLCTRKDEFAKRQAAMDKLVEALTAKADPTKAKREIKRLVKAAKQDIECLIRYREEALVPVLETVLTKSKKWFTRSRAAYGLKMLAAPASVPALANALGDKTDMVRSAAASALGHIGGKDAVAALKARQSKEKDPYVIASLEAALRVAESEKRPYDVWAETLDGPEGAKRVKWAWTWKGKTSFNRYEAGAIEDMPVAKRFAYPIARYKEDLFAGYPRNSFAAGGTHAGEDCAWFRDGCGYYAIADGVVRMVQGAGGDWGFLVVTEHKLEDGSYVTAVYGHCMFDVLVKPGDIIRCGQRIASQGLSCSVENGGYGAHIHFGLGAGPFRRPDGLAQGEPAPDGGTIVRFGYAEGGSGWPLTTMVVRQKDGTEETITLEKQGVAREIRWLQAYIAKCRGWLNPQTWLVKQVDGD